MTPSDHADREPVRLTLKGLPATPTARSKAPAGIHIVPRKRIFTVALMGYMGTVPPPDPA
jgi:hypothetical protein